MCTWFTQAGVVWESYKVQFIRESHCGKVDTNYGKVCLCVCVYVHVWESRMEVAQHFSEAEENSVAGLSKLSDSWELSQR